MENVNKLYAIVASDNFQSIFAIPIIWIISEDVPVKNHKYEWYWPNNASNKSLMYEVPNMQWNKEFGTILNITGITEFLNFK